jgi:predicted nuclease of predicted toxin-antitoxin system
MRFLADENFPGSIVESLKNEGHDIFWARVGSPGAKDKTLLSRAQEENRILLTFDKDFGELAFRSGLSTTKGIILFRITTSSPKRLHDRTLTALRQKIVWVGHFAVVEDDRIRLTPLPKKAITVRKKPESGLNAQEKPAIYKIRKYKLNPGKENESRRRGRSLG